VAAVPSTLPAEAEALEGTAEAIPLENDSVDGVTVAQAFHWFDGDAALREIARVLRPGGLLALIWNRRVEGEPVHQAIEELVAPYRGDTPSHRGSPWRDAFERSSQFGPLEESLFDNVQVLDADGLAARVGSISFIASLQAGERAAVLDRARAIAGSGVVAVLYRTELHTCTRP
jgi:SAM-dependent methyltransferase